MEVYVPNPTLGLTKEDAKYAVTLYYIEENEPDTSVGGGAVDIWACFVDSKGRLLGWIPGSNPEGPKTFAPPKGYQVNFYVSNGSDG